MVCIVQIGDGSSQRLDPCRRAILSACHGDIDGLGTFKASFNFVIDFGCALSKVGPTGRVILKAMLGGPLGAPYYASTGSTGVKAGMRSMAFVSIAELTMDLGVEFTKPRLVNIRISLADGLWRQNIRDQRSEIRNNFIRHFYFILL